MPALRKLTALEVRRTKGVRKLSDGGWFILNVRDSGAKSLILVYRFEGRRPEIGLDSWPQDTLSDARAKSSEPAMTTSSRRQTRSVHRAVDEREIMARN